jgi:asparagine synthase (glutamine-hydrolysing)
MSAIAGLVAFSPLEQPIRESVAFMMEKMKHRGGMDEGYVFFNGDKANRFSGKSTNDAVLRNSSLPQLATAPSDSWMVLGHRLGGIFSDVHPSEHQPFADDHGRIWAVLDGEIFNAPQVARELHEKGVQLETGGQVEILTKGYLTWGEGVLSRIEGSFSFLLYDQKERKILAARDPFGIKPFYYCHEEGVFAFASELKGLFGLPFVSKKISKSAVFDYLLLGESETHIQSIFRGLSELMPGSAMSILFPKGNSKIWSYFNMATDSKIDRYSRNKVSTLAHRLRKALVQNVSDHLSPGYPTAYKLSSEIESLVFPYLLKESIREMRPQERPDPAGIYSCLLQENTAGTGTENTLRNAGLDLGIEILGTNCSFRDFSENLMKVCYMQDVPFTSLGVFHQYRMLESAAAKGIKVVIEPVGGSQLFASSSRHLIQYLDDNLARGNYNVFFDNILGYRGGFSEKMKMVMFLGKKILFKSTSDDLKESLLRNNQEEFSYLKDNFKDRYFKNLENKIKTLPESLNQLLVSELTGSLVKEQLRTSDRNAQVFGVEVRHPFLSNRNLAEPVLKASSVYKIRQGQPANLLMKAMRGLFPDFVLEAKLQNNPKEQAWLKEASENLKEFITGDLDDFIDSRSIRQDWDKLLNSDDPKRMEFMWRIINLGVWRHVYFN